MSTTTTNLGLLKPEITDAADITAYNSNWDKLDKELSELKINCVDALSTDGVNYKVTLGGVSKLANGLEITIVPNMNNVSNSVTLNVNGLGAKQIRLPLSTNTSAMVSPSVSYFVEGRPVKLMYDANFSSAGIWKVVEKQKTSATDLYGSVPIASGGHGGTTAKEARTNLGITPANIGALPTTLVSGTHYGKTLPSAGTKGRIFFKIIT